MVVVQMELLQLKVRSTLAVQLKTRSPGEPAWRQNLDVAMMESMLLRDHSTLDAQITLVQ